MAFLDSLKRWLNPEMTDAAQPDPVLAASAALMAEIMRADGTYDPQEREALLTFLWPRAAVPPRSAKRSWRKRKRPWKGPRSFPVHLPHHRPPRRRGPRRYRGTAVEGRLADGNLDQHEQHLISASLICSTSATATSLPVSSAPRRRCWAPKPKPRGPRHRSVT